MNKEEKRTSLVKIIKNCQLFGKYIVIDTGRLLFIFNLDNVNVLSEKTYTSFKKDKNFKENFLNSSNITDEEGNVKILNDYIKYFEENYLNKEKSQRKISGKELSKIQKEIILMSKNLHNYLSVRKLGDIFIQEIYLKDKNVIDIKTIIKSRLQKIGIDYPLTEIEKIISFTDL